MKASVFAVAAVAASLLCSAAGLAADAPAEAPTGAWRTTNGCFLAVFLLNDGGRARAAYMTGEEDDNAAWTWDGSTLKITSKMFDLDSFTGHLAGGDIEAEYVWHDLDKDQLNRQSCVFERFTLSGI